MNGVTVRTATVADVAAVRSVLIDAWTVTYGPRVGQKAVEAQIEAMLPPEKLRAEIADPDRCAIVAVKDGAIVGVMQARPATYEVMVDRLYVAPAHRRQGVGQALMDDVMRRWPGAAIELSVEAANIEARDFYIHAGFVPIDRSAHPFGGVTMPCDVMRRAGGPDGLVIELAEREDVPALIAIFAADIIGMHGDTTNPEAAADYLAAFDAISASDNMAIYVARLDGRIVGTFQLMFSRSLTRRGALRATVEAVQVTPDLRGQGLGTAMIAEAERRARVRGAISVALTSNAARTDAHRFYERLGYSKSHVAFRKALVVPSS